jgi:hypothetical protein
MQWSLQAAISQQVINDFVSNPIVIGSDNGVPNFESRIGLGIGQPVDGIRPLEFGVSSIVGETRSLGLVPVITDSHGISLDASLSMNWFGLRGEILTGQGLGTYNAAIGQSLNPETLDAIGTTAGWAEVWIKLSDRVQLHFGYGIDDPSDEDLGVFRQDPLDPFSVVLAGQRTRNSVAWGNVIWNLNESFDLGFEVSHRETKYVAPSQTNDAMIYHFRARLLF